MDIRPIWSVILRKGNSEKTLMEIAALNETEAYKVFNNIKYPTLSARRGPDAEKFVKVLISGEDVLRIKEI